MTSLRFPPDRPHRHAKLHRGVVAAVTTVDLMLGGAAAALIGANPCSNYAPALHWRVFGLYTGLVALTVAHTLLYNSQARLCSDRHALIHLLNELCLYCSLAAYGFFWVAYTDSFSLLAVGVGLIVALIVFGTYFTTLQARHPFDCPLEGLHDYFFYKWAPAFLVLDLAWFAVFVALPFEMALRNGDLYGEPGRPAACGVIL